MEARDLCRVWTLLSFVYRNQFRSLYSSTVQYATLRALSFVLHASIVFSS